jgi:hypothetical protein
VGVVRGLGALFGAVARVAFLGAAFLAVFAFAFPFVFAFPLAAAFFAGLRLPLAATFLAGFLFAAFLRAGAFFFALAFAGFLFAILPSFNFSEYEIFSFENSHRCAAFATSK